MQVLMLGWEFPPLITGGLGTACAGLTRALVGKGVKIDFVLPRPVASAQIGGVRVLSPGCEELNVTHGSEPRVNDSDHTLTGKILSPTTLKTQSEPSRLEFPPSFKPAPDVPPLQPQTDSHQQTIGLNQFTHLPYPLDTTPEPVATFLQAANGNPLRASQSIDAFVKRGGVVPEEQQALLKKMVQQAQSESSTSISSNNDSPQRTGSTASEADPAPADVDYGDDLVDHVRRFTQFCVRSLANRDFDVIHAHDWMTYEAGLALRAITGKPLVVHVHSTEFDRSGDHGNPEVLAIESRGIREADRVICVSVLTRNLVVSRYGAAAERCRVVYNGVELSEDSPSPSEIRRDDRIVLYFGRITYQKGPEFFMAAAKKVLEHTSNVKFVVAGSGDQAERMIRMAAELGIGDRVLFTGFLRGRDISRVFSLADLYVMPSRSEPFGIAPLEAMSHGVPVLISKTSGVSEVLTHALKVDFWDIEDMASKIVAVLKYPPLSQHLKEHGRFEVRRITWEGAAQKCIQEYERIAS